MTVSVRVTGAREVAANLEAIPARLRKRLKSRIGELTEELKAEVVAAAPMRTGRLRSEITARLYADHKDRIAGYVSVYAPGVPNEYVKAGALEYGRHAFPGTRRLIRGNNRRAKERISKGNRIGAFRYLRGPLAAMRETALTVIAETVAEVTAESNGT